MRKAGSSAGEVKGGIQNMGPEAFINLRESKLVLGGFNFLSNQEKYLLCRAVLC
jgi:hypothetical protein